MVNRLWRQILLSFCAVIGLSACTLDKEDAVRLELTNWLHLGDTRYFQSTATCTVGLFHLDNTAFKRGGPEPVASVNGALAFIEADQAIRFEFAGKSPDTISREIMSADLARGIGLISSGIGPAQDCMEDWVARGAYAVLTSPEATMVYAPANDALLLVYRPEAYALYLRGNV